MYRFLRALLFLLNPELAHHLGLLALRLLGRFPSLCRYLRGRVLREATVDLSVKVAGLSFDHPLALAAGLDKNARAMNGLFACGFSALEVGTVTPRPQPGNPRPRLFRLPEHRALINRMGFNNHGTVEVAAHLRRRRWRPGPVGANIGRNKDTHPGQTLEDYVFSIDLMATRADYIVINASSPNTPGLRQLQEPILLGALLSSAMHRISKLSAGRPLFVKIAPDLTLEEVDEIVDVALHCRIAGIIATNTTVARPVEHPLSQEAGGLSGAPVREMANAVIRRIWQRSQGALPIIGVGGVFTAQDVYEKLRAGASLVQVYTGFVYEGPGMVRRVLRELSALLARDGFHSAREAIGADHRTSPQPVAAAVPGDHVRV